MKITRNHFIAAALTVVLLFAAPFSGAASLDALAGAEAPFVLFHLEDVRSLADRLADSELLEELLEGFDEKDGILDWLSRLPVSSVSMIRDSRGMHGAIRFDEESAKAVRILKRLAMGRNFDKKAAARLFAQPDDEALRDNFTFDGERISGDLYHINTNAGGVLYDILGDWDFFASVEPAGDEYLLLIGTEPELIESARAALTGGEGLKISLRSEGGSFLRLVDNEESELTRFLLEEFNIPTKPKASLKLELSLGLSEDSIELSLNHNMFDVLFKQTEKEEGAALDYSGLKFGGGVPFFSAAGKISLTPDIFLELIHMVTGADKEDAEDMLEQLEAVGTSLDQIIDGPRFFGALLGGQGAIREDSAPGGYVFISGEPKEMKKLAPLAKELLELAPFLEEKGRNGWEFFFGIADEYAEKIPLPIFVGMKKGVLLAGVIDENALEADPEVVLDEGGKTGLVFLSKLDMESMWSALLDMLTPNFLATLEKTGVDSADVAEILQECNVQFFLRALQEVRSVQLRMDADGGINLTFETTGGGSGLIRDLNRTIGRLTADL